MMELDRDNHLIVHISRFAQDNIDNIRSMDYWSKYNHIEFPLNLQETYEKMFFLWS